MARALRIPRETIEAAKEYGKRNGWDPFFVSGFEIDAGRLLPVLKFSDGNRVAAFYLPDENGVWGKVYQPIEPNDSNASRSRTHSNDKVTQ